ncbi:hypothetical protein OIU74_012627 [Salix koriyanagi]|uniref:Uncharacterized protein n=1 Tax=Salix koriyanagi TaxID=2511006 RepID=A0A9Q0Q7A3_9ROSI|nr:hypothetical protein OIU74_012627 [Salix koriyanagi]
MLESGLSPCALLSMMGRHFAQIFCLGFQIYRWIAHLKDFGVSYHQVKAQLTDFASAMRLKPKFLMHSASPTEVEASFQTAAKFTVSSVPTLENKWA